jgi:uridine nucleosidase
VRLAFRYVWPSNRSAEHCDLPLDQVHGNAGVHHTTINAAKCLEAFGAPASIKVYPGAAKPLIGEAHPAVDIHGNDGLGGVEGLPDASDPRVQARIMDASDPVFQGGLPAIVGMRDAALSALSQGKKLYLGVTGSCTNAALFLSAYPALAKQAIAQIVCMGGGVGIGNITAAAGESARAWSNVLSVPLTRLLEHPRRCCLRPLSP